MAELDKLFRRSKTILDPNNEKGPIAVLELSTKAVKLLIGDVGQIKENGFDFRYFYRNAIKTETGLGLDEDNLMDMDFFENNVVPAIMDMVRLADGKRTAVLYTVATAVYRNATNKEAMIKSIRRNCGINVKILNKEEEALATLTAFMFSRPHHVKLTNTSNVIMIDQGGGSTEISIFTGEGVLNGTCSLDLGTTNLIKDVIKGASIDKGLKTALEESDAKVSELLKNFYISPIAKAIAEAESILCVSVGSAITAATGKIGNPKQHGTELSVRGITTKIDELNKKLELHYSDSKALATDVEKHEDLRKIKNIDKLLVMRLGLPLFVEVLKKFSLEGLTVSGTGLWYGVYFENLYKLQS